MTGSILIPLVVGHLALFVLALNLLALDQHAREAARRLQYRPPARHPPSPCRSWSCVVPGPPGPPIPRSYGLLCLANALVGLPAVTLLRAFRRSPGGIATRGEELDLAAEPGLDRVVGEGKHRWLLCLPGNRSLRVRKVECELIMPGLPPALDGLNVVQVTDLHFSHCFRREFFEVVAEEAARWDADLVAFTGDLLDDPATIDWVEPVFSRLRGRLGPYAILGNHDHRLRPGRVRRALAGPGSRTWKAAGTGSKSTARRWPWAGRPSPGARGSTTPRCPRPTSGSS